MVYIMGYSRKSALYLFLCFTHVSMLLVRQLQVKLGQPVPEPPALLSAGMFWQSYSTNTTAEPLQSCTNVATAELHQLEPT